MATQIKEVEANVPRYGIINPLMFAALIRGIVGCDLPPSIYSRNLDESFGSSGN
jgi:hypothetical protein